jgi:serine/threonine protein kinase
MTIALEDLLAAESAGPRPERPVLNDTYRLLGLLAAGGMGEVHLASHQRLAGRFAVKLPRPHLRADATALQRFHAEALLLSSLRHPNIVQVIDFNVTADGVPYLVMELIEGAHLRDHLRRDGRFSPDRTAHVIGQLAGALQVAHDAGVVHCDLKLENIMLTSANGHDDLVKLLDFGIALTDDGPEVAAAYVIGTPQFMAPEQIEGTREEIDDRADQFALACIAYTLLAGREPFGGEGPLAVLSQVVNDQARPLDERLGPAFAPAAAVLARAMSKSPAARFATVREFAETLRRALDGVDEVTALAA